MLASPPPPACALSPSHRTVLTDGAQDGTHQTTAHPDSSRSTTKSLTQK